ncbi:MAG TPA: hypothetical protein VLV45_03450 [Gemmatimonadales bacterium]|nr:hypothetical protein [Gemmatimonadales bacterium]
MLFVLVVTTWSTSFSMRCGSIRRSTSHRRQTGCARNELSLLGYIGVVLGLVGLAATWNKGLGPRWYPLALVVLAVPQCWLGGKLYELGGAHGEKKEDAVVSTGHP